MAGLDENGFEAKPLQTIKTEMEDAHLAIGFARARIATSLIGQQIGVLADREYQLWLLGVALYNAFDPNTATGISLDRVGNIRGVERREASFSTVTMTLTGTPATLVPAGTTYSHEDTGERWIQDANATIGGGGTITANATAEDSGPVSAESNTITVIETPVAGLTSVTNATAAEAGEDAETDEDYRIRQAQSLRNPGTSAIESIRAAVLLVDNVDACLVVENDTLATVDSIPGKAFETIIHEDGASADDLEVATAIFNNKPAGIQAWGSTISESVVDSMGTSHTIEATRATQKAVEIDIEVTVDPTPGAYAGDDAVADALAAIINDLTIGDDVIAARLQAEAFAVAGVLNIVSYTHNFTGDGPTSSDLTVTSRQIARCDASDVSVTS